MTDPLIGRETERAEVKRLILGGPTRLISLIGDSGAGKTRLALEVAADLKGAFADGLAVVQLDAVQHPRFVLPAIAAALDIQESAHQSLLSTLINLLKEKSLLLVLDNVEQVSAAAGDIDQLVQSVAGLRVLVTSQVRLGCPSETVCALPPLALPPENLAPNPALYLEYPAVALFVSRLQAVQPRFRLTGANAVMVRRICQLLNGFPLAIELVAAHSAVLAPADLLLLLRNHLGVSPVDAAASSRSAILNPILNWCVSRLPRPARRLMEVLGVFAGGWDLDGACAVLAPSLSRQAVESALDLLVQKHLVRRETRPGRPARYVMIDVIQAYSKQRLDQLPERAELYDRHLGYYLEFAAAAVGEARHGAQPAAAIRRLDGELHNFRLALDWAYRTNPELCLRLIAALGWFWRSQGHLSEAQHWTGLAQRLDGVSAGRQGSLYYEVGALAMLHDRNDAALAHLEKGHALLQRAGDRIGVIETLNMLGNVYAHMENYASAAACYQQSMTLWDGLEADAAPPLAKINGYNNIGCIHLMLGQWDQALEVLGRAYDLSVGISHSAGIGNATINRGWAIYGQGRLAAAADDFLAALRIFRDIDDLYGVAETLEGLAGIHADCEQAGHAATLLGAADAIREQIGIPLMHVDRIRYYDRILANVRRQLSDAGFVEAWRAGRQADTAALIDRALNCPPALSPLAASV